MHWRVSEIRNLYFPWHSDILCVRVSVCSFFPTLYVHFVVFYFFRFCFFVRQRILALSDVNSIIWLRIHWNVFSYICAWATIQSITAIRTDCTTHGWVAIAKVSSLYWHRSLFSKLFRFCRFEPPPFRFIFFLPFCFLFLMRKRERESKMRSATQPFALSLPLESSLKYFSTILNVRGRKKYSAQILSPYRVNSKPIHFVHLIYSYLNV